MPAIINSTSFSGTSNNAIYLGGLEANSYAQTEYVDLQLQSLLTTWAIVSTDFTANVNQHVLADTSNSSFLVTLPTTPANNVTVTITDAKGFFDRNPLTVSGSNNQIMGDSSNLYINVRNASLTFIFFDDLGWRII